MLEKIYIKNYILIEELTIPFHPHFNVITGETGAGKSIILGALSLILGERADSQVLIHPESKCVIEGYFNIADHPQCQALLKEHDLDVAAETIIRREITPQGKSRAYINDSPVNLSILQEFTSQLVDLHRQFDNLAVRDQQFTYQIIDAIANNDAAISVYKEQYKAFMIAQKELQRMVHNKAQIQQELDYKRYLLQELEQFDVKEDELETLEAAVKTLEYADEIRLNLETVQYGMEEEEHALLHQLKKMVQTLQQTAKLHEPASVLANRLDSAWIELKDISQEISTLLDGVEANPQQLQLMRERLDAGYKLQKKHQVSSSKELVAIQLKLAQEVGSVLDLDEEIDKISRKLEQDKLELLDKAHALSAARKQAAPPFIQRVNEYLHLMGMPNAVFDIQFQQLDDIDTLGIDFLQFVIDSNKSGKFGAIQKNASGGELSRIMLAIKTITAHYISLPTMIFDEVDTGISGEAAKQVGRLMKELGAYHQIICITHQPQVAAKAHNHYFVYKYTNESGAITTSIKELSEDERVVTIAQMIGGKDLTEASMSNAKELMQS